MRLLRLILLSLIVMCLCSCGFQLRGTAPLSPPLKRIYIQTTDPYGALAHNLRDYFRMSNVDVTTSPEDALTVLHIISETQSQALLSVSGLQQTRQFSLTLSVTFEVTSPKGAVLMPPITLTENRMLTTQSDLILGSTNEQATLFQQMRLAMIYDIMNRLSSRDVALLLTQEKKKP